MALAWSNTAQDRVAYLLFNAAYSTLTASQKAVIDGTWTTGSLTSGVAFSAFTIIQQLAQWFELAGSTITSDAAMSWLVDEVCYRASISLRNERMDEYREVARASRDAYLSSVTPTEITTGYDTDPYTLTLKNIRLYVLANMVIRKPPVMMHPREIDSNTFWVLNWLWNKTNWTFRRRSITARITPCTITGGNWTNSTLTVSAVDTTNYPTHVAGSVFVCTTGTGIVKGVYQVASRPGATSFTLTASIAYAGADLTNTDIGGYIVSFVPFGLASGENLNAMATRKLYYNGNYSDYISWANGDAMTALRSNTDITTGKPCLFRMEKNTDTLSWYFSPIPDQAYTVGFEGLIALPGSTSGVPSSATDTVAFAKFPREFVAVMKDLILGRCLKAKGVTDEVWKSAVNEIEIAGLAYDDKTEADGDQVVRDVNQDVQYQRSGQWGYSGTNGGLGGGM